MPINPPKRRPAAKRKPRTPADNVKHVVKTWLPPGISEEETKDPGTAARKRARGERA
jgi:hypothetical protein